MSGRKIRRGATRPVKAAAGTTETAAWWLALDDAAVAAESIAHQGDDEPIGNVSPAPESDRDVGRPHRISAVDVADDLIVATLVLRRCIAAAAADQGLMGYDALEELQNTVAVIEAAAARLAALPPHRLLDAMALPDYVRRSWLERVRDGRYEE